MSKVLPAVLAIVILAACNESRSVAPAATTRSPAAPSSPSPAPAGSASRSTKTWSWNFDADATDQAPPAFSFGRTGKGAPGRWIVRADGGSNVLAQVDSDATSFRFPLAVAREPELRNVRVSVRCKPISGKVDQACGLVARYKDENNYLITRANALEGNIRLYTVIDGKRDEIATYDGTVAADSWHAYRLDVVDDKIEVYWEGSRVIDHRNDTFREAGRVGVWTKADSVTYFDDLTVERL